MDNYQKFGIGALVLLILYFIFPNFVHATEPEVPCLPPNTSDNYQEIINDSGITDYFSGWNLLGKDVCKLKTNLNVLDAYYLYDFSPHYSPHNLNYTIYVLFAIENSKLKNSDELRQTFSNLSFYIKSFEKEAIVDSFVNLTGAGKVELDYRRGLGYRSEFGYRGGLKFGIHKDKNFIYDDLKTAEIDKFSFIHPGLIKKVGLLIPFFWDDLKIQQFDKTIGIKSVSLNNYAIGVSSCAEIYKECNSLSFILNKNQNKLDLLSFGLPGNLDWDQFQEINRAYAAFNKEMETTEIIKNELADCSISDNDNINGQLIDNNIFYVKIKLECKEGTKWASLERIKFPEASIKLYPNGSSEVLGIQLASYVSLHRGEDGTFYKIDNRKASTISYTIILIALLFIILLIVIIRKIRKQ